MAFKRRGRQDQAAYVDARQRYQAHEEAIDRAFAVRQEAEQEALELYRRTIEKASEAYRERVKQALKACKETIDQVRKDSVQTSGEMSTLFQKDEGNPAKQERPRSKSSAQEPKRGAVCEDINAA